MTHEETLSSSIAARAFSRISGVIVVVQGIALAGIITLVLTSVVLRNFFDYGLVWVFEAAGFLMVTMVFLGVARNLFLKEDIAVDFVTSRTGARTQAAFWYLRKIIILGVSVAFAYYLFQHNLRFGHLHTPTLEIPHWLFFSSVMVGPGLAILITLWHLSLGLRRKAHYDRT